MRRATSAFVLGGLVFLALVSWCATAAAQSPSGDNASQAAGPEQPLEESPEDSPERPPRRPPDPLPEKDKAKPKNPAEALQAQDARLETALLEAVQSGDHAQAASIGRALVAHRVTAFGEQDPATVMALQYLAWALTQLEELDEARALYERVLALRETYQGADHLDTATVVNLLAGVHSRQGATEQALALYRRALAIREEQLGRDDPLTADVMNHLAWTLEELGRFDQARPFYEQVLAVREHGGDPEAIALALNNLAHLDVVQARYRQAAERYRRALDIFLEVAGGESADTANARNNLADALGYLAEYDEALALLDQVITIYEGLYGPRDASLAAPLNNKAQMLIALGRHAEAGDLLERSQAIRERDFGQDSPEAAIGLHNLAALREEMGEYDAAKQLYERALAIMESALGPAHPRVSDVLTNLAALQGTLGNAASARELLDRALSIRKAAYGAAHPDLAQLLHNLGVLQFSMDQHEAAAESLQQALDILEASVGLEHPLAADALNALSGVRQSQGQLTQAQALGERALAIREATLGKDHLHVYISIHNLAALRHRMGEEDRARAGFLEALDGFRRILGPRHPYLVRTLNNLGRMAAKQGDFQQALTWLAQGQAIEGGNLDQIMAVSSDSEKLAYLAALRDNLDVFLSLVAAHLADDPQARVQAADLWLARKGMVLEAQKRFQDALHTVKDPAARDLLQQLAGIRSALAKLTFAGPGEDSPEAYRARLDTLMTKKEALEKQIAAVSAKFAQTRARATASIAEVAASLPEDSVLVDVARVRRYAFTGADRDAGFREDRYLAFVLAARPKHQEQPQGAQAPPDVALFDLGAAAAVDTAVAELKTAVTDLSRPDGERVRAASRKLYDLVVAPLMPAMGSAARIILSTDGNLSLIPFEILLSPDGAFLIEDYSIGYLAAGRDAVRLGPDPAPADRGAADRDPLAGTAVILGDPAFDEAPEATNRDSTPPATRSAALLEGQSFPPLPATGEEVRAVAGLLRRAMEQHTKGGSVRLYTGPEARGEQLRAHPNPAILHLATHGFFLPDQRLPSTATVATRGFGVVATGLSDPSPPGAAPDLGPGATPEVGPGSTRPYVNPLLRSGLALTGANAVLAGRADTASGILTAENILSLDLTGTRLVTLSACETGLGEVLLGEGVFGLRRAFSQAGAESLVMSLWSVPDQETKELMVRFYERLTDSGPPDAPPDPPAASVQEALRQATLEQMDVVRRRHGWAHPFYWGAFIHLGAPRGGMI